MDLPSSRRDSSVSRNSDSLSLSVNDTLAEMRNKYSPANYVPACQRKNLDYMSRSKSNNDIGLPPIERSDSKILKKKVRVILYVFVCFLNCFCFTGFFNITNLLREIYFACQRQKVKCYFTESLIYSVFNDFSVFFQRYMLSVSNNVLKHMH